MLQLHNTLDIKESPVGRCQQDFLIIDLIYRYKIGWLFSLNYLLLGVPLSGRSFRYIFFGYRPKPVILFYWGIFQNIHKVYKTQKRMPLQ
ncbi:hypothetical protein DHD08_02035 [Arenibacter sp. H213]|nr:hypothetical protein [Arenibacter sp. H213]